MNVGSISSFTGTAETSGRTQFKTIKEDFKNLQNALKAGDLKAAQDAYAKLKQDLPTSKNPSSSGSSQPSSDLDAIGSALQSGDLAGAQKAFTAFKHDAQAGRASHAHHHHPDQDGDADDVASAGSSGVGGLNGNSFSVQA